MYCIDDVQQITLFPFSKTVHITVFGTERDITVAYDGILTCFKTGKTDKKYPVDLLCSNLQKAIRLQNETTAIKTACQLIHQEDMRSLLRQLCFSSLEDVLLHPNLCMVVWLYIAVDSGFKPSSKHMEVIISYIYALCKMNKKTTM